MTDARVVERAGIGARRQTFDTDATTILYDNTEDGNSAQAGLAVTLKSDGTIELVGDGEPVLGRLISVEEDDRATVQTHGEMGLPAGTGATLTRGKPIVGDLLVAAEGYIREVVASGAGYVQGEAQEALVGRGFIDDPSDTADVRVQL